MPRDAAAAENPELPTKTSVSRPGGHSMDTHDPSDAGAAWMLALQSGDLDAFDRIVGEYQHLVHQLVYRFTGQREMVEDLSQEVFLRVFSARDRYRPDAKFRTWLFTISYNLCVNYTKSRKLRLTRSLEAPLGGPHGGADDNETLRTVSPDRNGTAPMARLITDEQTRRLREALASLPPQQRAAITLYQYRGLSLREIASIMDTTEKAVKSLLARARENLRAKVAPYFGLPSFEIANAAEKTQ
jgi:RNA polymerase sigma-70 factor (ECF subfamily)